jgi:hypothetical protein
MRLPRFLSFVSLGLAAAFLVVASAGFSPPVVQALALGVSIGVLVLSTAVAVRFRDHLPTLATAIAGAVLSALMVVGSQVYSLGTVTNLAYAEGLALAAVALAGLTAHELSTERVVHSLEVRAGEREREPLAA